jgi:UDP-glucose 4-epimerase
VNPYGRSKLFVEEMIRDYVAGYDFSAVALRYFNAAGCDPDGRLGERHDPETHIVPLALAEARRLLDGGEPDSTRLKVFGDDYDTPDGTCIRDYIHVCDICRAHLLALRRILSGDGREMLVYNLANGQGFSVRQVIDSCARVTGAEIRFQNAPRRPGDPAVLVGDSSRIASELGWTPRIPDLDDIVSTAWRWMRQRS